MIYFSNQQFFFSKLFNIIYAIFQSNTVCVCVKMFVLCLMFLFQDKLELTPQKNFQYHFFIRFVGFFTENTAQGALQYFYFEKYQMDGDLVKIGDTKKLSKLIIKNLNKPDKSKILKMYKSLDRFNIKKHINKYEEIFRKI